MSRNSAKKKLFWTVAVVLAIVSVINFTAGERMNLSPVEQIFQEILAPLQSGASAVVQKVSTNISALSRYEETKRENEQLRFQLAQLQHEVNMLEEARLENFRLKNLLEFQEKMVGEYGPDSVPAQVIARSTGNWLKTITINKGRNQGVERDMAVVAPEGLVGRVIAVTANTAEVLLILDRDGAAGGMLQISRTPGIVEGTGEIRNALQMVFLPHDTVLRPNQVVVTSGLHELFPKGLRIGYVTAGGMDPHGLQRYAYIQSFVDFNRLEEVIVLPLVENTSELSLP